MSGSYLVALDDVLPLDRFARRRAHALVADRREVALVEQAEVELLGAALGRVEGDRYLEKPEADRAGPDAATRRGARDLVVTLVRVSGLCFWALCAMLGCEAGNVPCRFGRKSQPRIGGLAASSSVAVRAGAHDVMCQRATTAHGGPPGIGIGIRYRYRCRFRLWPAGVGRAREATAAVEWLGRHGGGPRRHGGMEALNGVRVVMARGPA